MSKKKIMHIRLIKLKKLKKIIKYTLKLRMAGIPLRLF